MRLYKLATTGFFTKQLNWCHVANGIAKSNCQQTDVHLIYRIVQLPYVKRPNLTALINSGAMICCWLEKLLKRAETSTPLFQGIRLLINNSPVGQLKGTVSVIETTPGGPLTWTFTFPVPLIHTIGSWLVAFNLDPRALPLPVFHARLFNRHQVYMISICIVWYCVRFYLYCCYYYLISALYYVPCCLQW